MSYNSDFSLSELDTISSYESAPVDMNFMGVKHKSMRMLVSWDHPITFVKNKVTSQERIVDVFLSSYKGSKKILYVAPYAPHKRTQDRDDIEWSARIAATFAQSHWFEHHANDVWNIVKNITSTEARWWLDQFFHWNVKARAYPNWMFATCLRNTMVRDMLFHIGPRAGVGVLWGPYQPRKNGMWIIKTSSLTHAKASLGAGWYQQRYQGVAWNISTRNGNVLAKREGGTFLLTCNGD